MAYGPWPSSSPLPHGSWLMAYGFLRYRFPRRRRLIHVREFEAVYDGRVRKNEGPLVVHAVPNQLAHPRLGLAISRRTGSAVVRNRIKRRLREAFRRLQHDLPQGYDLVVAVRPHTPLGPDEYQEALSRAARALDRTWTRKRKQETPKG